MENSDNPTKKPPKQVFNDLQIKNEALEKIAAGRPTTAIAKDYSVDPSTISKLKKRNQEYIEKLALQLAETVAPKYVQRITTDICTAKKLSKYINNPKKNRNNTKLQNEQDILTFLRDTNKVGADIMRSLGIFPAQSPSLVIQNIYQDQRQQTVISPDFQEFMDYKAKTAQPVDMQEDVESDDN